MLRGAPVMQQADEFPVPEALINEEGVPQFGIYYRPFATVNVEDFDYRKVAPFPLSLFESTSRRAIKRWQYMGFASSEVVVGMAVVDIGHAHTAFVYVYNRASRQLYEHSYVDVLRRKATLSESSLAGVSEYVAGKKVLRMDNRLELSPRRISAHIPGALRLEIETDEAGFTPLCAVTRNGLHGYNYCHKAAGFPVSGFVEVGGERFEFRDDDSHGALDWTAGCLGRNTFWNWASAGGRLKDGRRLGLNLVSGVNDRGFTENVYWIDGKPTKVDVIDFAYDSDAMLTTPWRIQSNDGRVDLSFQADSERAEDIDLGLLISRFHQPFGRFEGRLEIDGVMQDISLYGMVEEHQARW
jgi:hypothetical protein